MTGPAPPDLEWSGENRTGGTGVSVFLGTYLISGTERYGTVAFRKF